MEQVGENNQYFGKDLEAMSFAENYHQWILDEFSPYLGKHAAEIGAGSGNFSDFLLNAGVEQLVAFEPSDNMFPSLDYKFKNNDAVTTVHSFFEDQSAEYQDTFDSICYVNVLEHIEHDGTALKHAYKTLKPNGYLLIFVPALPFLYSELDKQVGHFRRYTRKSLTKQVEAANFTINNVKYFDIAGIIPWYIAFVLLKGTSTEGNVAIYDKWIVPTMRRVEQAVPPCIGKNLLLIAQKVES